jgi:putative NADH-flavin reductase
VKLLIVGAGGRTGRILTRRALEHGHDVTAFVHNGSPFRLRHPRLTIRYGDVRKRGDVERAAAGHDAIVSVLAPRGSARTTGSVYIEGTRNIADAAEATGVRRVVVVSAEGAGVDPDELPMAYRIILTIPVVARLYPDIAAMERELTARANLDWTIVRAAVLTNQAARGRYRTSTGDVVPDGLRIGRADLADYLLRVTERREHQRERVAIAY